MVFVLFRNPQRLRTCVDVRVGKTHLVEVIFQLRRQDYDWYIGHNEEIHGEILELLESTILSRMFSKDIEDYHRRTNPLLLPPDDDDDNLIGSKTKKKNNSSSKKQKGGGRAKTKSKKAAANSGGGSTTSGLLDTECDDDIEDGNGKNDSRKVFYSFGSAIQLAYRKQPIGPINSSSGGSSRFGGGGASSSFVPHRTILVQNQKESQKEEERSSKRARVNDDGRKTAKRKDSTGSDVVTFYDLDKLPYRLLVWISPSSSSMITGSGQSSSAATGSLVGDAEFFHRPEMIPVSSLFRTPAGLEEDDDDDDGD